MAYVKYSSIERVDLSNPHLLTCSLAAFLTTSNIKNGGRPCWFHHKEIHNPLKGMGYSSPLTDDETITMELVYYGTLLRIKEYLLKEVGNIDSDTLVQRFD